MTQEQKISRQHTNITFVELAIKNMRFPTYAKNYII